jgi:signal peptidase I
MTDLLDVVLIAIFIICVSALGYLLYEIGYLNGLAGGSLESEGSRIVNINGTNYNQTWDNYYNFSYEYKDGITTLEIDNPCIRIKKATGVSMEPFLEKEVLIIFDYCFREEDLKVGDMVSYSEDHTDFNVHHRIVQINHEDRWIRTKGDNNITNEQMDDITSFDFINARSIGFLNILAPKILVNNPMNYSEQVNISEENTSIEYYTAPLAGEENARN